MKIQELKCEQFAGMRDCAISFEDGLNLIVGPNESGKSTMLDLLYYLFFQNRLNGTKDKDFIRDYYPITTGSHQADTIDGSVTFDTDDGTFVLSKEWQYSTKSKILNGKLVMPDKTIIRDNEKITEILDEVLQYGKATYDEIVFSSQKREQTILQGLLGDGSSTTDELSATITKTVMQTGGIDIDKMEKILDEKVGSYTRRWDLANDLPEGGIKHGIKNQWHIKENTAMILEAYYEKETVADKLNNAKETEKRVANITASIAEEKGKLKELKDKQVRFMESRTALESRNSKQELRDRERNLYNKMRGVQNNWPQEAKQLDDAKTLKKQYDYAEQKSLYDKVKEQKDGIDNVQDELNRLGIVDDTDIKNAKGYTNELERASARLSGLDLMARIIPLGANDIQISTIRDGKPVALQDQMAAIKEAVRIHIPDVVDIELMPKDVDVKELEETISEAQHNLDTILQKYAVTSLEDLEKKKSKINDLQKDKKRFESNKTLLLGNQDWSRLQEAVHNIPADTPLLHEVENAIQSLCGKESLDSYIGGLQSKINGYINEYGSLEMLAIKVIESDNRIKGYEENLQQAVNIPAEFAEISDLNKYSTDLKDAIDLQDNTIEKLRNDLSNAERNLGDKSAEDLQEQQKEAEEIFAQRKEEYNRWARIQKAFYAIKDSMYENPLTDVEANFRAYLAQLSDGAIALQNINDKLTTSIVSNTHPLTDKILSEGTKDTISLAFRLAVLEHLYPEGNAIAVFDDPFTDMDPQRTAEACKLIQKFAQKNQVLFVTCDDKYKSLLDGHVIEMAHN